MKKIFLLFLLLFDIAFALTYPNKPIEFVVGFGEGGSSDRMARQMAGFLKQELNVPIKVKNMTPNGSIKAANYLLDQDQDGYTVFVSAFSPHFLNTMTEDVKYEFEDFQFINLQWFDYEFISVHNESKFNTLLELMDYIKDNPKQIEVGVINRSNGHLLIKLLLHKFNIPQENIKLTIFNGGKVARLALVKKDIDALVIASQGSEKYRDHIKPLAIWSKKRSRRWDAPTLNEILKIRDIQIPIINGSMRGIAVTKKFAQQYPSRYKILKNGIKKVLAKRAVQNHLKNNKIGYTWIGEKKTKQILLDAFITQKKYNYLLDN